MQNELFIPIYYTCSNLLGIKKRDHNNFMNNMSSFIPVGPKISIKSNLVIFLHY